MIKKLVSLGLVVVMAFSMGINIFAAPIQENPNIETMELSERLSSYFEEDDLGNVNFTASLDELIELGISEQDALLMLSVTSNELRATRNAIDSSLIIKESVNDREPLARGFVGLVLKLGPKIRAMNGIVAGAFAGGFVGWHLKEMAAAGPWGAGAAAAITATVASTVGYAVTNGLRSVRVGVNVPRVSWSRPIYIP